MVKLEAMRGVKVSFRRMRDCMAFEGVLEHLTSDEAMVALAEEADLQKGDKCVFWLSDMIFVASFEAHHIQSFLSRLDTGSNRLSFRLLAAISGGTGPGPKAERKLSRAAG